MAVFSGDGSWHLIDGCKPFPYWPIDGLDIRKMKQKEDDMLWTIAVILIVLWLAGFVSSYTMGGFIHILLVVAIIMVLVNVISGRR
jgi:hypothetical protein